jgi:hypothetical protein
MLVHMTIWPRNWTSATILVKNYESCWYDLERDHRRSALMTYVPNKILAGSRFGRWAVLDAPHREHLAARQAQRAHRLAVALREAARRGPAQLPRAQKLPLFC